MLKQLKHEIESLPWYWQWILFPLLYFPLWVVGQIFSGCWWVLTHLYGEAKSATGKIVRPLLVPAVVVGICVFLYYFAPQQLGALLQLVIVVAILFFVARRMLPSFGRKAKKKSGEHH